MIIILTFLIYFVAIEHLGIMAMEIFGKPEQQAKTFGMPLSFVHQAPAKAALGNMGIYNGMLAVVILASQWVLTGRARLITTALLLVYIVIVAIYGSLTVKKSIFWLQGMPALVTFIVLLTQLV
ncbi:DUF1304 domain-containing protein [Levilactobacillus suantsaiihabitans]|uniref:DUF1304 domain-containing protein n=1 Tax=Levilactobacillus suantsaiihabitans TaxID=2487722 RepID=A0A4Z0J9W7_9LACO|nr:DUF1304 domain-containing protein [Levilactobacillus suantsaiihabitans]TGD19557.1 DUF1304 domain-containing protein [Levilactobacillus suantsaiihabitans]